jgi:hypothetical protein
MRGLRVIVEVLHVAAGIMAALLIGAAAAWAYPIGRANIWLVTYVSVGIVILMGARPIVRALQGSPSNE